MPVLHTAQTSQRLRAVVLITTAIRIAELTETVVRLRKEVRERSHAEEALRRQQRKLEHLLRAGDYERQLTAYEIHDGLAQQLTGGEHAVPSLRPPEGDAAPTCSGGVPRGMTLLESEPL